MKKNLRNKVRSYENRLMARLFSKFCSVCVTSRRLDGFGPVWTWWTCSKISKSPTCESNNSKSDQNTRIGSRVKELRSLKASKIRWWIGWFQRGLVLRLMYHENFVTFVTSGQVSELSTYNLVRNVRMVHAEHAWKKLKEFGKNSRIWAKNSMNRR